MNKFVMDAYLATGGIACPGCRSMPETWLMQSRVEGLEGTWITHWRCRSCGRTWNETTNPPTLNDCPGAITLDVITVDD